jgi:hypothetical protein
MGSLSRIGLSGIAMLSQTSLAMSYVPVTAGVGCHIHSSYPGHVVFIEAGTASEIYWDHEIVVNQYTCTASSCFYQGNDGITVVMSFSRDLSEIEFLVSRSIDGRLFSPPASRKNVTCAQN